MCDPFGKGAPQKKRKGTGLSGNQSDGPPKHVFHLVSKLGASVCVLGFPVHRPRKGCLQKTSHPYGCLFLSPNSAPCPAGFGRTRKVKLAFSAVCQYGSGVYIYIYICIQIYIYIYYMYIYEASITPEPIPKLPLRKGLGSYCGWL